MRLVSPTIELDKQNEEVTVILPNGMIVSVGMTMDIPYITVSGEKYESSFEIKETRNNDVTFKRIKVE